VLLAIAAQHAAALTRARMYEVERDRSLTLQAALAPNVRRSVNGVEVGVHYRPAGVQAQVGGDWADALALDDGRVVLAIGDVMGSGIPAAATMGRLRTALETLVRHGFDPVQILCDLDRLVLETPGDLLATLALAVLDPDAARLELYNAGHLPTLLCPPDGPPFQVEAPMVPPLGVGWSIAGPSAPKAAVDVAPGTVLALCTDGLLETRDSDIDERLALWRSAVQAQQPLGDLAAAARTLVDAIVPSQDDDVTLLLARASRLPR
jgi:serine phosphatase RsbU (regulator of sigma subunit)